MTKKRAPSRRPSEGLEVVVEHVPAPDAQRRLTRSFDLLMRAGVRQEQQKKA